MCGSLEVVSRPVISRVGCLPTPTYPRLKIIEGVEVINELCSPSNPPGAPVSSPDPLQLHPTPAHSHVDFITDLSIVPYKNQQFVVSASHDGVFKLWK